MTNTKKVIKKLPKEVFDNIYSQVPRLCVEVVIYTSAGVILGMRLIPACTGMWHIPGGTVYHGERLEEAVNRIAYDELGIEIDIIKMIGVIQYPSLCEKTSSHAVGIAFLCKLKSDEQKLRGSDQAEEFKAFKSIPDNTVPEQKIFLDKFLDNRKKWYGE